MYTFAADPDGTLDGQYGYLFYEATVGAGFQTVAGWGVAAADLETWLRTNLPVLGLNARETADFVEYWTERLPPADKYAFYPQWDAAVDAALPLTISPEPESVPRLWVVVESMRAGETPEVLAPRIPNFTRTGFTAVEWGVILK